MFNLAIGKNGAVEACKTILHHWQPYHLKNRLLTKCPQCNFVTGFFTNGMLFYQGSIRGASCKLCNIYNGRNIHTAEAEPEAETRKFKHLMMILT
jgi:hypothetical protein